MDLLTDACFYPEQLGNDIDTDTASGGTNMHSLLMSMTIFGPLPPHTKGHLFFCFFGTYVDTHQHSH